MSYLECLLITFTNVANLKSKLYVVGGHVLKGNATLKANITTQYHNTKQIALYINYILIYDQTRLHLSAIDNI